MSLRKKLAAAMLAEALRRDCCSAETERRIVLVGGPLDPADVLRLQQRREYYDQYTAKAAALIEAYVALPKDVEPETLEPALSVVYEALAGDDDNAYLAAKSLDPATADAVIYAIGMELAWERDDMLRLVFGIAEDCASESMRHELARIVLDYGVVDDGGVALRRVEALLGRPLTTDEWHDHLLDTATDDYFAIMEGCPDGAAFVKAVLTRGAGAAIIRLIARRLLDWEDDTVFAAITANIRD